MPAHELGAINGVVPGDGLDKSPQFRFRAGEQLAILDKGVYTSKHRGQDLLAVVDTPGSAGQLAPGYGANAV